MLRKVNKLHPYVAWVLERDGIPYFAEDKGEYVEFSLEGISSRRFTNVVEDAKCEKQRLEGSTPNIPVLSYRAAMNTKRMNKLLDFYGTDCFVILKNEAQKCIDAVRSL